ncbi:MAG: hypothetical protein ACRCZ9_01990, partial [Fusobacteriaceae bacterium]
IVSIGNGYREKALKFLEIRLVNFLTSDAHRRDKRSYNLKKELEEIETILGKSDMEKIWRDSFKVVSGEKVEPLDLKIPPKKSWIEKIKKKLGLSQS